MTTINPVQTPVTQAPAFRGKTTKAQQKAVDALNRAFRENQLKEMMKVDPEIAKIMKMQDCFAESFTEYAKRLAQGFLDKIAKAKP